MSLSVKHDWHKYFFRDSFYNPASPAARAKAPMEAAFVLKQLKLKKGSSLLDLCCGPGRHAIEFARKGLSVTGYDFSGEYLRQAQAGAKKKNLRLKLIRGDMRELKFREEFDAAVNLFTSFGYFLKLSDDIRTLKGVARALKPGGLFLLDIVHGDSVRGSFRSKNWMKLENGAYHLEDNALTKDGVASTWTLIKGNRVAERSFFTRLYSRRTLGAALRKAGLKPVKFWGSFRDARLTPASARMIVLAVKPG